MARARSTIGGLKKLLAECAEPVYVVDDERRLVYCNPACVAWTGWPLEQLLGAQCDYHTRPDGPASAGLGPPPEAFQSATWEARVSCRRPDGTLAGCAAHFHRLSRGEAPPAVLVLLADRPSLAEPAQAEVPASQLHECLAEMRQAMGRLHAADQFVGVSPAITRVRDQVHLATAARSPVLIQGPPGSERERVARTIHYLRGGQQPETLVPLSCALLDPELLQTTVHAFLRRQPEFEWKESAALLLLDADQLTPESQLALESVLGIVEFDVTTLSTSRQSLLGMAQAGDFRPDLAYRLSTLVLELPPLSTRKADLPLLAQMLLEDENAQGGRQLSRFSEEALDELAAHEWPGNMTELRGVVRAACQRAAGPQVLVGDLPRSFRLAEQAALHPPRPDEAIELDAFLAQVERELLERALRQAKGNKARAARLLGVNRARLLRRLQHFNLS